MQVMVDAKLTRTLDLIFRYTAAVKRDYYRAITTLQELQRVRKELATLVGEHMEGCDER
jgi:hypothetical protein